MPVVVANVGRASVPVTLSGLGNVAAFYTVTVKSRVDGQPNNRDRCWLSLEDNRQRREVRPGEIGLPDKAEEAPAA